VPAGPPQRAEPMRTLERTYPRRQLCEKWLDVFYWFGQAAGL
jgi:hypothetical protein